MTNSTLPVEPNQYFLAHDDAVFVSDLIHGSKLVVTYNKETGAVTKSRVIFNNVTVRLTERPAVGDDASAFQRGDFWNSGVEYMFVRGTTRKVWAVPFNDQVSGGGGGITPQQLQAIYSRDFYSKNVVFHDSTSAARPNVSNVVARPNRQATFDVDGGWTYSASDTSTYKADIYILASGQGDSNASGFAGAPEAIPQATEVKPFAEQGGRQIQDGDVEDGTLTEGKLVQALQDKINEEGAQVKPYAAQGGREIQGSDIQDNTIPEDKLDSATQTKINREATAVKPFADASRNPTVLIQGTDMGANTVGSDQLAPRSVGPDELQTNSVTDSKIPNNELTEGKLEQSIRDKLGRVLPTGGNPGDVITKGQGSLFSWAAPTGGGGTANVATWAQVGNTDDIPDEGAGNKISNRIARRAEVEGEIGTLEGLIEAGATSRQLRLFDHDMRIIQHPEGRWEPTTTASIATSEPAAFLFENSTVEPNSVPIEPGTDSNYSFASRGTTNFVRIHQNPNSDSNAFHGVTPYVSGLNNITTPANQKKKLITGLWSQGFAARAGNDVNDDTSTFLGFGTKRLIRFNQRGIDVSIGSSTPTNRDVTHFVGLTTITLQRHTRFGPISARLPDNANGTKLRLSSRRYLADSTIPQSTGSVEVNNLSSSLTNFSIPVEGQAPITGTVQYNSSNRALSFIFTGGFNITNERFEVHIDNEVRERINYPATPQFAGILAADQPENDDVFRQGDKQQFVFAIEKQFDEPDADNNIMKLVYRIDNHTGEVNLRQTRAELMLDGNMTHIASSLQYLSHLQLGTYTGEMTRAITENIEVETIGWGQVVKNSIDDDITLRAGLYADKLGFRNSDGTIRDLAEAYSWAQLGNPDVLPEAKIPASMRVPGQTLEDVIINVTNPTTVEADAQRIAFGQHDLREQNGSKLKWIAFPVQWKEGATAGEASDNNNRPIVQQILIDIDQLPTDALIPNQGDEWERIYTVRQYPGSYQKLIIRVWQRRTSNGAAGGAGVGSIWLGLYYRNFGNGHNYVSPTNNPPGDVPAAGITHFAFFHFGGGNTQNNNTDAERLKQIRLVPKAQKGDPGDDGPTGPQGAAGAPSTVPGPKGEDSTVPGPKGDDGESGQGVATGGTAGQVLSKVDATDFNTKWIDPPSGGESRTFSGSYNSALDFNTLSAAGNSQPEGMWSDGTTMWVANDFSRTLFAYNLETKARDSAKDFTSLLSTRPQDMWSDGTTMWISDFITSRIDAYNLATKARDSSKDFTTLAAAGNTQPQGIWSDGTTMWVGDSADDILYAYNLATKARDSSKDFTTLVAAGNRAIQGIWSDGTTMWVVDNEASKVFAYNLQTKAHDPSKDFNTLTAAGNTVPKGIWSDGTTMWITDDTDRKVYAYEIYESAGLNEAAVDARVKAGVQDWAESGNTDSLPDSKIPASIARDTEVTTRIGEQVKDFAKTSGSAKVASGDTDFATRLLPSNPGNNQIAQWNGTAWVAINTPTGGGGATVSGTSGWGTNLLTSDLATVGGTATINLSGELDSVLVVGTAVSPFGDFAESSVEVIAPMSGTDRHTLVIDTTFSVGQQLFGAIDFDFPTTTGANGQIRFIRQTTATTLKITGVYKKTRLSGSAPSGGGNTATWAQSGNTDDVPAAKLPQLSSRIGFSVSGVLGAGVSRAQLASSGALSRSTNQIITCGQTGSYHKLSFTKFGTEAWANADLNGNLTFTAGDFGNIVFRCDFSIASLDTPSGGNDRLEVGMAVVQLHANATRTIRKIAIGQYMRNTTQNPAFRTANVEVERSLTLPTPFVKETWEVYLYCEATAAGKRIQINRIYDHDSNQNIAGVGGGAYLLGHRN